MATGCVRIIQESMKEYIINIAMFIFTFVNIARTRLHIAQSIERSLFFFLVGRHGSGLITVI